VQLTGLVEARGLSDGGLRGRLARVADPRPAVEDTSWRWGLPEGGGCEGTAEGVRVSFVNVGAGVMSSERHSDGLVSTTAARGASPGGGGGGSTSAGAGTHGRRGGAGGRSCAA